MRHGRWRRRQRFHRRNELLVLIAPPGIHLLFLQHTTMRAILQSLKWIADHPFIDDPYPSVYVRSYTCQGNLNR